MSELDQSRLEEHAAGRWGAVFDRASATEVADALAVVDFVLERLAEADGYGLEGVDPGRGFASDATIVDWLHGL